MTKRRNLNVKQWAELISMVDWAFKEAAGATGSWHPNEMDGGQAMFDEFRDLALNKLDQLRRKSKAAGIDQQTLEGILEGREQTTTDILHTYTPDYDDC